MRRPTAKTGDCGFSGEPGSGFPKEPVRSNKVVADNTWHHVAGVRRSDGTREIWVDGVRDNTRSESMWNTDSENPLYIGEIDGTGIYRFTGLVDEVEVFNVALKPEDILAIFKAGSAGKCKACQVSVTPYHQCDGLPNVPEQYNNLKCSTCRWGCSLTASASMLTSFPADAGITPASLDAELAKIAGYDKCPSDGSPCCLVFAKVPEAAFYSVQLITGANPTQATLDEYLKQHLCQGDRVLLVLSEYLNGSSTSRGKHFVVVLGKNGTDWNVLDPGWKNASPSSALGSLQGHYTGFTTYRNSTSSDPDPTLCPSPQPPCIATFRQFALSDVRTFRANQDPTTFFVVAHSPVELLIQDSQGRRLGNLGPGTDVFEIPLGSYFRDFPLADDNTDGPSLGDPTATKTAYIASPETGAYVVQATGTTLGTFTLDFQAVAADASVQTSTVSGVTNVGSTATYQTTYSSEPGAPFNIGVIASLGTTLADISNSLALNLIDNQGIADALSSKINAASNAAAGGDNKTARNILNAFISQVNAQTGKHITGIAPQVLVADANSLLSQLQ